MFNFLKRKNLGLRIGDIAPDFNAETTQGVINFHQWLDGKYAMLFSHPKDFTPVCSTELSRTAALKSEFDKSLLFNMETGPPELPEIAKCEGLGISTPSTLQTTPRGLFPLMTMSFLESSEP